MDGLTVAVPTRDRREMLLGALESIAAELGPNDELLVVDNGSQDGSAAAAGAFLSQRRIPGRVLAEPDGGVSRARNRALRAADRPVVCFVDDDVRVQAGWLDGLRHAWAESETKVACIGGPLLPLWKADRPPWLVDNLIYVVSVLDLGGERRALDQAPRLGYVWGGNMSLRVEPALAVGGFDPARGVRPDAPADRGEEEELQRRLVAAGFETWYEPAAAALHLVPPERLTEQYFANAFRARGRAEARGGRGRGRGAVVLARAAARYALLGALGRSEATTARFWCAYGWTLLTASRARRPRPPAAAL